MRYADYLTDQNRSRPMSAGGVPVLRKWNERPSQLVIIRGDLQGAQDVLRPAGFDRRFSIVKRSVELNLAERAR
jgi:hypothetical protein